MNGYAGWRVALRLARREAWRRKGQTALMLVLIALPVLAVSTAAVVWKTATVSGAEGVTRRMGAADALATAAGPGRVEQCFDPADCEVALGNGSGARTIDIGRALGGRPYVPLRYDMLSYPTTNGVGDLMVLETDLADPLSSGLLRLTAGRMPRTTAEIVINAAAAARGPQLGQTLELTRKLGSATRTYDLRIVGIAENARDRTTPYAAALLGATGRIPATDFQTSWLVGGGPVSWPDVERLNRAGLFVASREVITDPPPDSALPADIRLYQQQTGIESTTITIIALIASMVLLEVVLLAGPAFAVRAKAQAHALALVAATGGTPAQARRTILASGVVIGAVGGVVGAVLGVLLSYAAVPIAQDHSSTWFGPREVPWVLVVAVAGFGFVSAFLAAVVPAYSASRQDVVAVLAGRRGEGRPSRRSPFVGLVLIGLGIAGALVGSRAHGGNAAAPLVGGSAIVSVIGMIFFVPVAVMVVARLAARLPLALRFAARDAARHRTRTVPAVAAVGATVAGVVALSIALSSQAARDRADYAPQLPMGYGAITLGVHPQRTMAKVGAVLHRQLPDVTPIPVRGVQADDGKTSYELELRNDRAILAESSGGALLTSGVVASRVPAYLGLDAADAGRANNVLADGGVAVLPSSTGTTIGDGRLTVVARRYADTGGHTHRIGRGTFAMVAASARLRTSAVAIVLSPQAAARLKVPVATTALVLPPGISTATQQDLTEALAAAVPSAGLYVERGYQTDSTTRIIQWVLALLGGVLMLGGTLTATFLALTDAKPDLATMAAVGARPRTRRAVAAAYALVVGGVGAVLGAPIGFIPGVAVSRTLTRDYITGGQVLDVPWLLIGLVVVALPLLTAATVGLWARSRLPLVARID
ncbi:hypothetical protein GCM10028801_04620 [Nocardioides maradonensis]